MRLLFLTRLVDRKAGLGGFTYHWVKALSENVANLDVICLEAGDTSGLPDNCRVYSLGKESGAGRWKEFWRFHSLARQLVSRCDGILAHQNPEYGILVAFWAKLYNKKLIGWYTHKAVTFRLKLLTMLADRMITASAESFRYVSPKLKVLHHGIDVEHFAMKPRINAVVPTLLSINRLSPSKNIDLILKVAQSLRRRGVNIKLLVAGAASSREDKLYEQKLKRLMTDAGLNKTVVFLGSVSYDETPRLYQSADLVLNFSDTGSLDKTVLEALATGLPVLTTNEAFRSLPEKTTIAYYSSKDLDRLTDIASRIIANPPSEAQRQGGRDYVRKHHELRELMRSIIELYGQH